MTNGGDWLPLVYPLAPDTSAPLVSIIYPENITYYSNVTSLNYTVYDGHLQACWYSLNNGQTNITITCGVNITGLNAGDGSHTWTIWANDTYGNENKSSVTFSVNTTELLFNITIISPESVIYTDTSVTFAISTNKDASNCWYNLDSSGNTLMSQLNATFFNDTFIFSRGSIHTVNFTCNDTNNNFAYTSDITFRIAEEAGCTPRWNCDDWSNCTNGKQNRTCIDENRCGRGIGMPENCVLLPDNKNICIEERACIENCIEFARIYSSWSECISGTQKRAVNHSYICEGSVAYSNTSEEYFNCICNVDIDVYWPLISDLRVPYNSTITFHAETSDKSVLQGETNLSIRWYINDILEKEESTSKDKFESDFAKTFESGNYKARLEVSNNCSKEEIEWQIEAIFSNCTEDWQCEWSECSSKYYKYPFNCFDVNECTTNLYYPSPKKCYCVVLPNCTEWEECIVDYSHEDVLRGNYILQGMQKRYCNDSNHCLKHQFEERRICNLTVPVEIKKVERCHSEYLNIYETKTNKLVATFKEQRLANMSKLFVMFTPTDSEGYCSYCYDGIKNYDEEGVDCGGPNCPVCVPKYKDLFWLWKLLAELIVLSAIVYLAFSLENARREPQKAF